MKLLKATVNPEMRQRREQRQIWGLSIWRMPIK